MAIKISGTTVVDDSRNLSNIAGADTTTRSNLSQLQATWNAGTSTEESFISAAKLAGAIANNTAQAVAGAWANANGTTALRDSYNVDSISSLGTGYFGLNFGNNFANDDYSGPAMTTGSTSYPYQFHAVIDPSAYSSSQYRVRTGDTFTQNSASTRSQTHVTVHGELA